VNVPLVGRNFDAYIPYSLHASVDESLLVLLGNFQGNLSGPLINPGYVVLNKTQNGNAEFAVCLYERNFLEESEKVVIILFLIQISFFEGE